ncbi:hypothetical protein N8T08_000284 [Aspergillus melleus]|uniref:Uncharacterized protein n=1 Tax=Aspergillus melleus TaxID=138277 RepID=A0ACC3BB46_9EURO|nr:hypothetical protein N8T08_000284 [Aspergillus melleus]
MPPRRSISPLALETCPPSSADLDSDGIVGSDDELDSEARAAQRRRIEKLAGAYLQGQPLFILSASLRGPFDDQQWKNPWRKARRQSAHAEDDNRKTRKGVEGTDSPVIQETNPRKRRQPPNSQEIRQSQASKAPSNHSGSLLRPKKVVSEVNGSSSCPRPLQDLRRERSVTPASIPKAKAKTIETISNSDNSTPIRGTDKSWLKKDRDRLIKFHNFDPPTSPTSKISSRHHGSKRRAVKVVSSPSHLQSPGPERHRTTTPRQNGRSPIGTPDSVSHSAHRLVSAKKSIPSDNREATSHPNVPPNIPTRADQETSFSVLSSSSHLPQFEFRRKKRRSATPKENGNTKTTASIGNREHAGLPPAIEPAEPLNRPDRVPQEEPSTQSSRQNQTEDETHPQESNTLAFDSKTFEDVPVSYPDHAPSTNNQSKDTSEKLPSAQIIQQNPAISGYMTSLHSTAVPKGGTEDDGDTVPDHQFSTQAALLLAQRSFQNDLESQHHESQTPALKRRGSDLSRSISPPSNNITPFYRLSTPDYHTGGSQRFGGNGMAGAHMISTQGMIDAVTPFTFSTDKKEKYRRILTPASAPASKKAKTCSFADTSPTSPRHNEFLFDSRIERVPNSVQSHRIDTQHSALPMTLTGTTPPTVQDAQDGFPAAETFNLSQAIAEAGSWLQQSFEINKEISQCRTTKPGPSPSRERQAGLGVGPIS